jgi:hypothetical protein
MADQVTAFVTLDQAQIIVATSDLNDRGAWALELQYEPRDAVLFDGAYYQCLLTNIDKVPTLSPDEWGLLVFVVSGTAAHTADQAYALAEQAYGIAISGTNGVAHAEDLAYLALLTAWAGTNAAASAQAIATTAINISEESSDLACSPPGAGPTVPMLHSPWPWPGPMPPRTPTMWRWSLCKRPGRARSPTDQTPGEARSSST